MVSSFCTGCWAPHILQPVGINIPQYQFKHSYVVTEGIEGVSGLPNIRDPKNNFYLRTQGDAVQIGSFEHAPPFLDNMVRAKYLPSYIQGSGIYKNEVLQFFMIYRNAWIYGNFKIIAITKTKVSALVFL